MLLAFYGNNSEAPTGRRRTHFLGYRIFGRWVILVNIPGMEALAAKKRKRREREKEVWDVFNPFVFLPITG